MSSTAHCLFTSNAGWIKWRETQASLFRYFETKFKAEQLKLSEVGPTQFLLELEIRQDLVKEFEKKFKDYSIVKDIDRIHGVEGLAGMKQDTRPTKLSFTQGSGLDIPADVESLCSIQNINLRVLGLATAQSRNLKELEAIHEQVLGQMQMLDSRLGALSAKTEAVEQSIDHRLRKITNALELKLRKLDLAC